MHRRIAVLAFSLVVVACGGAVESEPGAPTADTPFAIVANSSGTLAVGEERMLIDLLAPDTESLALPDRPAEINIVFGGEIVQTLQADFLWTVPDVRGLYRVNVTFDQPGVWAVIVSTPDLETSLPAQFQVFEESSVSDVGDVAPASVTPTAVDEFGAISSDRNPNPRFYEVSLDEAFTTGQPTVVAFSTPAFCTSGTCGPVLDILKAVASEYPEGVQFVHVEVYVNLDAASFDELILAPAIDEWKLPSEPWVFVVGADGIIVGAYEGVIDGSEVRADLEAMLP